jgi:hypothetical protein
MNGIGKCNFWANAKEPRDPGPLPGKVLLSQFPGCGPIPRHREIMPDIEVVKVPRERDLS